MLTELKGGEGQKENVTEKSFSLPEVLIFLTARDSQISRLVILSKYWEERQPCLTGTPAY